MSLEALDYLLDCLCLSVKVRQPLTAVIKMSSSSEKFCLNWNDFQKNISSSFQEMRDDLDLADVTLACEDRKQFLAHKLVLSASSPFFKDILQKHKHPHPLIYLKGMKAEVLDSVLNFLYRGAVNIYQEDLNDFLVAAEELELKGLTGQETKDDGKSDMLSEEAPTLMLKPKSVKIVQKKETGNIAPYDNNVQKHEDFYTYDTDIVAVEESVISVNNDDIKEKIESMIEKIGDTWVCKMCGQKNGHGSNIRRHIESKHTTGGSHPCKVCGKIFRSACSIKNHMYRSHQN